MDVHCHQQGGGGSTGPIPSLPDFATMSEEEQIAMAMQMSLQSEESAATESPVRNPPGAPRKPKREDNNENKNNSEDRKRPRESEGSAGGSNPPTPGRKGGRLGYYVYYIIYLLHYIISITL